MLLLCNTNKIEQLQQALKQSEVIVIGAGAGLSSAAGYNYTGERFQKWFKDFENKYHIKDMYTGGFYPYTTLNEYWAYWSRYIYINRYVDAPKPLYHTLYNIIKNKDYFVITTNVDHCFQKAGFDKKRLFYTQGDYGLLQCSVPCHTHTYDNKEMILKMLESQCYQKEIDSGINKMFVPDELIPYCKICGKPMSMNLRADDTFVQDNGWYQSAERYQTFLKNHKNKNVLFLELGVGYNTPSIIKYPFWKMTNEWKKAKYVCINQSDTLIPKQIQKKAICINDDIETVINQIGGTNE